MKARIGALMAEEGLPYGEGPSMTYNTRLAQELAKWADTQDGGGRIHDDLFRAFFVDGVNLAKTDELVRIAETAGLSGEEARTVLDTRAMKDAVDRDWQRSMSIGVTGVPTFMVGERGVVGWQPYDTLERLVQTAGAEPREG